MTKSKAILKPEYTYLIYSRANGNELLFKIKDNYRYFLQKYDSYISLIADTYCYCLMPNHFHFLNKIKGENDLKENLRDKIRKDNHKDQTGFENLSGLVSCQFSNLSVKIINAIPVRSQRPTGINKLKKMKDTASTMFPEYMYHIYKQANGSHTLYKEEKSFSFLFKALNTCQVFKT
jgi:hypothetical protein